MSQPANDDFSQHLSDDEASYHEDASDNGTATNKPKQQQQQLIPTTTTISNIKLPILKKEEYDIWAMEMEHYLEYIDNDVWKVIQNGNSKKRISTGKDGVVRVLPPVSAAEIHVGPQKPEISDSDDNSTEHSTCQSNDSEGSFGNPSEHSSESESESISVPNEMSTSKSITANEKVVSKSKEVEPSCVTHVKTPRKQMKNQETHEVKGKNWNEMMERELGEGYSFIKKKCFVCGSLSHLIKDCDYYEKKMAREAEFKKQRVFNTGNRVAKPVWTNANRVNHANHFIPRPVQLNAGRPNVNSVRPNITTGQNENSREIGHYDKTSAGYKGELLESNSNCDIVEPTYIKTVTELKDSSTQEHGDAQLVLQTVTHTIAGTSEVSNSAVKHTASNMLDQRKSSATSEEDSPEILAFRRELDELAQKHLREVPKNKATSNNSINSGSGLANTQHANQDDSDMLDLTIFNTPKQGIFDAAS
ncbi:hypothetical protein Tco_1320317 [Tanacetum coccineum]